MNKPNLAYMKENSSAYILSCARSHGQDLRDPADPGPAGESGRVSMRGLQEGLMQQRIEQALDITKAGDTH